MNVHYMHIFVTAWDMSGERKRERQKERERALVHYLVISNSAKIYHHFN